MKRDERRARARLAVAAALAALAAAGCGQLSSGEKTNAYYDGYSNYDSYPGTRDASAGESAPPDAPPDVAPADADDAGEVEINVCELPVEEPQVLFLSADDSNSQASPVIARWMIRSGMQVPWQIVRTYEFTNYYDLTYEAAPQGRVRVTAQMMADPEEEEHYRLQIGVQSHAVSAENRRPMNVTFSLDTSGSMSGTPIALEKKVCGEIAANLRSGDVVSMVTWNDAQAVVLDSHVVSGPDDRRLRDAIEGLSSDGSTNLHEGLALAYQLAEKNRRAGWLNRVVLVSDGQANTGITDEELIARHADDSEREGIYLVGVGVGSGYNDTLMDVVTDKGKGAYVFIDGEDEAQKMFGERFYANLEIAVKDVRVALTLPAVLRMEVFYGEEVSTNPKEVEPQHLAPNDAMIFQLFLKSCAPFTGADVVRAVATYIDPASGENRSDTVEAPVSALLADAKRQLEKGYAVVKYAEGLKEIGKASDRDEKGRVCGETLAVVEQYATALADAELDEIAGILTDYCGFFR